MCMYNCYAAPYITLIPFRCNQTYFRSTPMLDKLPMKRRHSVGCMYGTLNTVGTYIFNRPGF